MYLSTKPLIIRAPMKKENYIQLLREAGKELKKVYLRKNYRFDGSTFVLECPESFDVEIAKEAALVAKYAEPTDACVGIIHNGGNMYEFNDLYFRDGLCHQREIEWRHAPTGVSVIESLAQRKKEILASFPKDGGELKNDPDVEAALQVEITYEAMRCYAISYDVLDAIMRKHGHRIRCFDSDEGWAMVMLEDEKDRAEDIVAKHFGAEESVLIGSPGTGIIVLLDDEKSDGVI